jgi:hypothetical protein
MRPELLRGAVAGAVARGDHRRYGARRRPELWRKAAAGAVARGGREVASRWPASRRRGPSGVRRGRLSFYRAKE